MRSGIVLLSLALSACGGGTRQAASQPDAPRAISSPAPVQDDTAALQAAVDQGGTITLAPRTYHISSTIVITKSGTIITGSGAQTVLDYRPTPLAQQKHCANDRVITTSCAFDDPPPRQVGAPIAVGDTSFLATDAADVSDLMPGEWILVNDYDQDIGDRVAVDWMQVQSVDGFTVNVTQPFRMAFTTARAWVPGKNGLGFEPITPLVQNIALRDFNITVEQVTGAAAAGISLFGTLNATVDNVTVQDYAAQPLYCYLSKGVTITNSQGIGGTVLSEFASSVDVIVSNNRFTSTAAPGFGLDLGLGFFQITGNMVEQSANAGLYLLYGVHDGTVSDNQVSYVESITAGFDSIGILLRGAQNVMVTGNALAGGEGVASVGISFGSAMGELPEPNTGNSANGNAITGFVTAINGVTS